MGWFLLKRFVDLVRVCYLHIIVRNHSACFHWLTCRKEKLVQGKALQQRLFVLILGFWHCRQVFSQLNVHFNDMQLDRWLYLSSSPTIIPLHCDLFWKRRDPKISLFIGTNNWIVSVVRWSMKYIFAPNMPIF